MYTIAGQATRSAGVSVPICAREVTKVTEGTDSTRRHGGTEVRPFEWPPRAAAVMYEGTNTNRIPFHQRLVFAPSYIAAAAVGGQSNGRYPEVRFTPAADGSRAYLVGLRS